MVSYRKQCEQTVKLQAKSMGPYCVVEVLPNYKYRLKRSGQVSVQSEQRLKPCEASPDAVGQAPPFVEPNCQLNTRGRVNRPREWEIFVRRRPEPDPQLDWNHPHSRTNYTSRPQGQHPHQWKTPPPLMRVKVGDPTHNTRGSAKSAWRATLGRSQRNRRPPRYLVDYHVGYMELLSLGDSTPSMGNYLSNFVQNLLQYSEEFLQSVESLD